MNGAAVVVPRDAIPALRTLPGVRAVDASIAYRRAATTVTDVTRAARAWSTGLPNQGAGIKIGIIDDGIDQTHAYFSPAGYTMPPGLSRRGRPRTRRQR